MTRVYGLLICILSIKFLFTIGPRGTEEQKELFSSILTVDQRKKLEEALSIKTWVTEGPKPVSPRLKGEEKLLHHAIVTKLGRPYRYSGTNNEGYDCSGFVWRVFHETGIDFERSSARGLWKTLPKAKDGEKEKFGTLVFFKNPDHVGIVNNADTFYHAAGSVGVELCSFSEYWESRIKGHRRIPLKK